MENVRKYWWVLTLSLSLCSFLPSNEVRASGIFRDPNINENVIALALQPDGKIVICGIFSTVGGQTHRRIARVNSDGTVDGSFVDSNPGDTIRSIALQTDGKILVGGSFTGIGGLDRYRLARLNHDGTVDTSFQNPGVGSGSSVDAIAVLPNGKILIGGDFTLVGGQSRSGLALLNADGSLDGSFNIPITGGAYISDILVQPDQKILIAGAMTTVAGQMRRGAARLNADGSVDLGFQDPIALRSEGGWVKRIILQPDGRILIAGVVFASVGGQPRQGVTRLNSDGSLDPSFNDQALPLGGIENLRLQPDGKVIIVGGFRAINNEARKGLARLNTDGTIDPTFTDSMLSGSTGQVQALGVQTDAKIVIGGNFTTVGARTRRRLARFGLDGRLEAGQPGYDYDADERTDISVFRPTDGAWYLRRSRDGFFGISFGSSTDQIVPADYDGDGKTDVAVYRPSIGIWYITNSSNGSVSYYSFGIAEDVPTPADYDADGKADISVFRPSTGTWYRQNSSNGAFVAAQFGASGDKPTIGDFDGDRKADIAVFRPSTGAWYQTYSSNGFLFGEQFGISTDKITPADYDGDGKTDIAIYRPSEGLWYVKRSATTTYVPYVFGLANDVPVASDYDGDDKADIALFRPSDGTWYIVNSSNGSYTIYQFGQSGDRPTQSAFGG